MNNDEFRKELHKFSDWIADYYANIEEYPVKSQVKPRETINLLESIDSLKKSDMQEIFSDFERIIIPGITHWQSPNFFAYFPANASSPSILAEMLTSALAAQCMVWETSPAAAELEEYTMNILRDMIGLPKQFNGVIQDTASTATLTSLLVARERASNFDINFNGFSNQQYRIYCSAEAHSSIDKAVKIAGFGSNNLIKINVDDNYAMKAELLEAAVLSDIRNGYAPLAVVSALGTTGSTAIDPIAEISQIAKKYNLFHHVDAALAGTALILPEFSELSKMCHDADSFVFNPHKWMFTNFDCSAYFIKDKHSLTNTFSISPEYLKTDSDEQVNNYRDWGIQLGRRFRALKLWFVLRSFGLEGLQTKIRSHIELAKKFAELINHNEKFELLAPVPFNTVCFRLNLGDETENDKLNASLLSEINRSGKMYISHTKLSGKYTLRFVVGQTNTSDEHVLSAYKLIDSFAAKLI